ncbi:MAG: menaquinone biosynthesis protein [Spirochaetes bacterium]|nr:menaquinone biosynthesis protein [Spirochaetota bacterium]
MRLGYIDYLNCYPFYYLMFEKEKLYGISIIADYPRALNEMIAHGNLHMSPISSAAFAKMQHEVCLLREFCLSSIGYVRSVVLASNVPIEDLEGKRVALSSASETSVVLLKVLLQRYYRIFPSYIASPPFPDLTSVDAALVIGNEALSEKIARVKFMYDIGELWRIKTGYPVVFAVFAVRNDAIVEKRRQIDTIVHSFHKSIGCLENDRISLIGSASKRYPEFDRSYIDDYYRLLKFSFTDELRDALRFYFDIAAEERLIEKVPTIRWYSP